MDDLRDDDPGRRGSLSIADKVIDKLAEQATVAVDGVVPTGSGLEKFVGRQLPKVSSSVRGDQARVNVDIAVRWPMPLADVAADVRSAVAGVVTSLAGLDVTAVDVSVSRIEQTVATPMRRVQ